MLGLLSLPWPAEAAVPVCVTLLLGLLCMRMLGSSVLSLSLAISSRWELVL
jgi:hypothetical protein